MTLSAADNARLDALVAASKADAKAFATTLGKIVRQFVKDNEDQYTYDFMGTLYNRETNELVDCTMRTNAKVWSDPTGYGRSIKVSGWTDAGMYSLAAHLRTHGYACKVSDIGRVLVTR